jgi:hypothetical protein
LKGFRSALFLLRGERVAYAGCATCESSRAARSVETFNDDAMEKALRFEHNDVTRLTHRRAHAPEEID